MDEFGKVCEVQSDKASIEITSRYTGRIVKLHHQQGDIVKVAPIRSPTIRNNLQRCCWTLHS